MSEREEQMEHDMEGLRRENQILWDRNVELLAALDAVTKDLQETLQINRERV